LVLVRASWRWVETPPPSATGRAGPAGRPRPGSRGRLPARLRAVARDAGGDNRQSSAFAPAGSRRPGMRGPGDVPGGAGVGEALAGRTTPGAPWGSRRNSRPRRASSQEGTVPSGHGWADVGGPRPDTRRRPDPLRRRRWRSARLDGHRHGLGPKAERPRQGDPGSPPEAGAGRPLVARPPSNVEGDAQEGRPPRRRPPAVSAMRGGRPRAGFTAPLGRRGGPALWWVLGGDLAGLGPATAGGP